MNLRLLATVALFCALGVSAGAQADDLTPLKKQVAELAKKNKELTNRIEKRQNRAAAPAVASLLADAALIAKGPSPVIPDNGPICWKGICVFGSIDAGVAWQSHGVPLNGAYPQGLEYGISRNSNRAGFHIAPGATGYSGLGVKGAQELLPGLSAVFAANSNFSAASGQLSNGPASLVQNNGIPLAAQSANGDSRSAGQAFNDYAYAGLSSRDYGELTFGRQRTLTTDDRSAYDPISGSLAFSLLGYSGSLSSGDTENSRFDEALRYRLASGPIQIGAIYKFAGSGNGVGRTDGATYQVSAGFDYEALSFNAVYSHVSGAVTLSSLTAAQLAVEPANTLAGAVSDNQAVLLSLKYTAGPFKFFGGYEHYMYSDPRDPLTAPYADYNGYAVSVVTNNAYQYHHKIMQLGWAGLKYALGEHIDLSAGYYLLAQNSYGKKHCWSPQASTCGGAENAVGAVAEYHFNKRLKAYAGLMYSVVNNGMASGYLHTDTIDPTVGLRYDF